jgi:glycerol-3-phosphate O-acyltransferase
MKALVGHASKHSRHWPQRSRTGRLLLPRLGVVKYLMSAFQELSLPDLYFVPVYIGYDQVIEQSEYLEEIRGEKEKGNALFSLLRSWRLIRENSGRFI